MRSIPTVVAAFALSRLGVIAIGETQVFTPGETGLSMDARFVQQLDDQKATCFLVKIWARGGSFPKNDLFGKSGRAPRAAKFRKNDIFGKVGRRAPQKAACFFVMVVAASWDTQHRHKRSPKH